MNFAVMQMPSTLCSGEQAAVPSLLAVVQERIHGSMCVFTQKRLLSCKTPSCLVTLISLEWSLYASQNNGSYPILWSSVPEEWGKWLSFLDTLAICYFLNFFFHHFSSLTLFFKKKPRILLCGICLLICFSRLPINSPSRLIFWSV